MGNIQVTVSIKDHVITVDTEPRIPALETLLEEHDTPSALNRLVNETAKLESGETADLASSTVTSHRDGQNIILRSRPSNDVYTIPIDDFVDAVQQHVSQMESLDRAEDQRAPKTHSPGKFGPDYAR